MKKKKIIIIVFSIILLIAIITTIIFVLSNKKELKEETNNNKKDYINEEKIDKEEVVKEEVKEETTKEEQEPSNNNNQTNTQNPSTNNNPQKPNNPNNNNNNGGGTPPPPSPPRQPVYSCPGGYSLSGTQCISTIEATFGCPAGLHDFSDGNVSGCISFDDMYTISEGESCRPGEGSLLQISLGGPNKTQCVPIRSQKVYSCPGGYSLSNTTCTSVIAATVVS